MIDEILELVKGNNRVIIPNFGAFIISKENGYSVLFNNFLSFNDGLLVNFIAEKRKIDTVAALDEVNKFVESINSTLNDKGEFVLKGLGKFTKDDNGIMRFHQNENIASFFSDSTLKVETKKPEPSKDLLDIDNSSSAPKKEDKKEEEKPLKGEIPGSLKKENLLQIDQDEKKEKTEPLKKEPVKKEPIKKTEPIKPQEKPKGSNITIQKQTIKSKQQSTITKSNKEKRNKKSILIFAILFILIPVLAFVVYQFFIKTPEEKQVVDTKVQVPKPIVDTIQDTVPKTEPVVEVEEPATYENKYHIIAGTFTSERAAEEYVIILQGKGFGEAFIIPRSGKYLVSIDSEIDLISAEALQEKIVNTYRIENYIITVK